MRETVVLIHGSANGAYSWRAVHKSLAFAGVDVFAPDLLGYGKSPPATALYDVGEEAQHLARAVMERVSGEIYLGAHSLGATFALHLRRELGGQVTKLLLIEPVNVDVLRQMNEAAAFAEMEAAYAQFVALSDDVTRARMFVEHWSGPGSWDAIGERARAAMVGLAPKVRLEMEAARADVTPVALLAAWPPATTILLGEKTREAPRAVARVLARAFLAETIVVPGAGHLIPITHPNAVVDAILRGLSATRA